MDTFDVCVFSASSAEATWAGLRSSQFVRQNATSDSKLWSHKYRRSQLGVKFANHLIDHHRETCAVKQDIKGALDALLLRAVAAGRIEVEIRASELRAEGPSAFELSDCRSVMLDAMMPGDEEVAANGPHGDLAISFYLPRI
jgi:hypothetical protein